MPENEILDEFVNREIETMQIFLVAKATRTATTIEEYIATRLLQGTPRDVIEKDLLDDLDNNGRMFSEFRSAIRTTANGVISRSRDNALYADYGIEEQFRWVAVLINTCPDCLDRHGITMTYSEWEAQGLPRTGATVCRDNCNCVLLPASTTIIEPLLRAKK